MNKICLLGGSNSVMKAGLNLGLCDKSDYLFALGATSSIQNVHAICTHIKEIEECDFIVTESNVNDIYNIHNVGYDKTLIINNIKYLYEELYNTGKNIISIIIPIKQYHEDVASIGLINEINLLHKKLSNKYGFHVIDLANHFASLDYRISTTKFIQPDPLHPLDSFMYTLGCNIRQFIKEKSFTESSPRRGDSNFNLFTFPPNCNKKNSRFSRALHELKEKIYFVGGEGKLFGIETWSDDLSELIIESNGTNLIKRFSSNLSFNEITNNYPSSFYISSHLGESLSISEPSVNVECASVISANVKISSLLFLKNDVIFTDVLLGLNNIDRLIPDINAFTTGVARFLEKNIPSVTKDVTASYLRDAAIKLEKTDVKLSFYLMKLALEIRPNGAVIKKKKLEYKNIIDNQKNN